MQQRDGALSALELMQPASLAEPAGAVVSHEHVHWGRTCRVSLYTQTLLQSVCCLYAACCMLGVASYAYNSVGQSASCWTLTLNCCPWG